MIFYIMTPFFPNSYFFPIRNQNVREPKKSDSFIYIVHQIIVKLFTRFIARDDKLEQNRHVAIMKCATN